ncbi:MAG: TetR/AcrR family transcriptional regulator [Prevotella sp.]|nr:TetR/AcrR family transcriptional regulator [Prevotella sp.]
MQDIKEATSYRTALREPIMEIAMKLFTERGIKAVKMDDIAQQLGISKRTLYEVYEDKEKLLYQGIVTYDRKKRNYLEQYARQGHHVIDIIIEAYRMKVNETRNVNPLFYEDIMKYPKVELYIKEQHKRTREGFLLFMQRGVDEGCLRSDVDYTMVPHLLDAIGNHIMTNQLLKKHSMEELFNNLFLVTLRGLCTMKGLQLLEEAIATKIR